MKWDGRCFICGEPVLIGAAWAVALLDVIGEVEVPGGCHVSCLDQVYEPDGCETCAMVRRSFVMAGRYGGDPGETWAWWDPAVGPVN